MTVEHREPPACPRCGYDQSGLLAAWTSKRPLCVRCSECGLDLEVARIMNPEHYRVGWFFEHLPNRRFGLLATWHTWLRAVLPWRFWGERDGVRLDSEFAARRLMLWLPMLIAPVWALSAVLSSGRQSIWTLASNPAATHGTRFWLAVVANGSLEPLGVGYFDGSLTFHAEDFLPYHVKAWLLCCLLMPGLLLALSKSRMVCKVRLRHVLRASVYGFGLMVLQPVNMVLQNVADTIPWPAAVNKFMGLPWDEMAWTKAMLVSGSLGVAWFATWWYVVIVRVFRLRHARWIWLLLMVACVLVFAIMAAIDHGLDSLLSI